MFQLYLATNLIFFLLFKTFVRKNDHKFNIEQFRVTVTGLFFALHVKCIVYIGPI